MIHSIQSLIISAIILSAGMFVFIKSINNTLNRAFLLFCLSVFVWLFMFALMGLSSNDTSALFWARIGDIGIVYLPIFAYYFTIVLLEKNAPPFSTILKISFLLSIPTIMLIYTPYIFIGMKKYSWGQYPIAGPLYFITILFFALFVLSIVLMIYYLRKESYLWNKLKINQIKYVLIAYLGAVTGFVDYLPKYNIPAYPWGHLSALIFILIIAYAILKHHLMDITIIIRRGLIYMLSAAFIVSLYFILMRYSNLLMIGGIVQPPLKLVYVFAAFCAMILHLILGIFVFINSPRKTLNRVFSLLSLFIFVWIVGCFIQSVTKDQTMALITERFVSKFYVFTPPLFLHTFYEILNIKNKRLILCSYLFAGLLCVLSFTNLFLTGVSYNFGARYLTAPGPLFFLFPLSITFNSWCSLSSLVAIRRNASGYYKIQLDYLFLAGSFIIAAVFFSHLLIYKIIFTPFDEILNIAYGVTIGYAILKHRLMDITIVIRKGLIYSVLIGLFTGLYILMLYFFSLFLGGLGARASIYLSALLIIVFAISFQPLRDKIQEFIDKVFFRGKYDYQKTLKELSLVARSIAGLDELLDKVLTAIVSVIKLNNASIYVLDKRGGKYFARRAIGIDIKRALPENDDTIKQLATRKEAVMYDEVSKTPGNISGFMREIGAAIIFPIITKDELVGLLCLGEKLSGEVYSDEDIDLLTTLCNQMGASIENAMLYEDALEAQKKLYQADKLATVGALAAGLAHEIKNPIAAIKGFSQVIGKAVEENDAEAIKDFKDVVPRQLDRINEIVEKLLTLSRPPKLERKKIDINVLLNEIVRLIEKQALKQRVEIVKSFEELSQTLADPEQLTQAFLNLILNAIQSMPDGGQIEIRTRFMGTDRIVVEIIDNGIGIPKEKRAKIFDPFYTTKAGGSGLGLSVTQKIIIDHHGKIDVESEVGKGATFKIILPVTH